MTHVQPSVAAVAGFRVAGIHAGLKKTGAEDMALIVADAPCPAAAVFTTNRMQAAPVIRGMAQMARSAAIRAVVVNTRCANACTGAQGLANADEMARLTAEALGCAADEVFVMSTGVIGTQLPIDKIAHGAQLAAASLGQDWAATARGIMTTDTRPKLASLAVQTPHGAYTIAGIAKGAGMIAPNMATMLGVVVTDAELPAEALPGVLRRSAERTFNRIVIDGDMSTNDTLLLLANGASSVRIGAEDMAAFEAALEAVCRSLAQAIVRDGEGVTKFITLGVTGAPDDAAAHQIANAIATSPLVKTAFFGKDANWGRIVAAAGRSGVAIEPAATRLWITPGEIYGTTPASLMLFDAGMPTAFSEAESSAIFQEAEVSIHLSVGDGPGTATVWTCDLSHDYVSINGDYRS